MSDSNDLVLITGATGCIGARLLRELQRQRRRVRCLVRNPDALTEPLEKTTDIVQADVLEPETLDAAFRGVSVIVYLVHSMKKGARFEALDRQAARNVAAAARRAGVRRIVYLGGLGDDRYELSCHLRSRQETGEILRQFGGETIELRAAIVIGSGSLSFEMIRSLVERLPVMITPSWVSIKTQPISMSDLLAYLCKSIDHPISQSCVIEIGGADVVSYGDLIQEYARQRGLRRFLIPVPVVTPRLSGLWLGLVTPLYARVGRALIDSIRHETVVRDSRPAAIFDIKPMGMARAIELAMCEEDRDFAIIRWSESLRGKTRGSSLGPRLVDSRSAAVCVDVEAAFKPISQLGGARGWYAWNFMWRLRGLFDRLLGGPGLRSDQTRKLAQGEILDFWRIESYEPPGFLRLKAEMRLPGRAWLQFEVTPTHQGSLIRQTAIFDPRGLFGLFYWYGLMPIHALIFPGLLKKIARRAEALSTKKIVVVG